MSKIINGKKDNKPYKNPLSLYPLKPEKALSLFMKVKPEGKNDKKKTALSSA